MNNPNNCLITREVVENILNYFGGIEDDNSMLKINNFFELRISDTLLLCILCLIISLFDLKK